MSRNKVYYRIFETATHAEYHVSSDKQKVMQRAAMSRRIPIDSPEKDAAVKKWNDEANFMGLIKVSGK